MLNVLNNSKKNCFAACPRKYQHKYVHGRKGIRTSDTLSMGTYVHQLLEAWWKGEEFRDLKPETLSDYDFARARAMLEVYNASYNVNFGLPWEVDVVGVEHKVRGEVHGVQFAGTVDAVVRRRDTGDLWLIEHKTTSSDIGVGSSYWDVLPRDTQVSMYLHLVPEAMGVVYDVLKKPAQKPKKATPEESRKYTKQGFLYKNQQLEDETPLEYYTRILTDMKADPSKYLARQNVVRIADEVEQSVEDFANWAHVIKNSEVYPKNHRSCNDYGSACEFYQVCWGGVDLDDSRYFTDFEDPYKEETT